MSLILDENRILSRFKELIQLTCGFNLEMGREQTLREALHTRMAACAIDGREVYLALLARDHNELDRLVELLTVNETYFFREPDHLNLVADKLVPELLTAHSTRQIRIVSAGCSTGEEAYSVAMMLRDRYGTDSEKLFCITGVDIDSCAIAAATKGVYGKGSFRGMDPALLERHFLPVAPGQFRVRDSVRDLVNFEVVNLLGAYYPQLMRRADIILYRNVSIYFPQEVQRKIFVKLADLLNEGGHLMVGAAETLQHDFGILSLVRQDDLFYYRKPPAQIFEDRRQWRRNEPVPVRPAAAPPRLHSPSSAAPRPSPMAHARPPEAVDKDPALARHDPRALFDTALELASQKRPDQALEIVDAIVERDPAFTKARILKGSLLVSLARLEEAEAVCADILCSDPLCLEAHLMLGIIARHQGDDEVGFGRFREAIYLDPSCWLAHFHSAEIRFLHGDVKRARSSYETALRILEKGTPREHGQAFFPLSFNAEPFLVICRHKLSLLKENG